jgi:DNA-binding SARP family transcriptional activator
MGEDPRRLPTPQRTRIGASAPGPEDAAAGFAATEGSRSTAGALQLQLLGGFSVRRATDSGPILGWQRRTAKTLIKLLACQPTHGLHREEILELMWPGADLDSGLNSFGKALHAARRALEPDLPPRRGSSYLRLVDSMLSLDTELVEIDADRFEHLAQLALKGEDEQCYVTALESYSGRLLPEDLYEEWCEERRRNLAELQISLLSALSTLLARRGAFSEAADRLRDALQQDASRENLHRRLMRMYIQMGTPDLAVRQFHVCEDALRRQLDLSPEEETVALYRHLVSARTGQDRSQPADPSPANARPAARQPTAPPLTASGPTPRAVGKTAPAAASASQTSRPRATISGPAVTPIIGRERALEHLLGLLRDRQEPVARTVIITGEAGVGKTRFLQELAARAGEEGAAVLWGGAGGHAQRFGYGAFSIALEAYAGRCSDAEREVLARRYPALGRLVPSLGGQETARFAERGGAEDQPDVLQAIVRLLTDLGRTRPVLLVVGDLSDADHFSLDLLRYLAHLAMYRPWLIAGAVREEEAEDPDLRRLIASTLQEDTCVRFELGCLSREQCDALVRARLERRHASPRLLETIYARSRGNPLFVEELVDEFLQASQPAPGLREAAAEAPPGRARMLATMQLATMPATVRRVLELASLVSAPIISLEQLRAASAALEPPIPEAALFDALDHALRTRVLEERKMGYAFRYPVVRAALANALSRHRRAQLLDAVNTESGDNDQIRLIE